MERQEPEILCCPDGIDRNTHTLLKSTRARNFKADIGFYRLLWKDRGLLLVCRVNVIPCVMCAALSLRVLSANVCKYFLHLVPPGNVTAFLLLLAIMSDADSHGPYESFSFVFQVGFSNRPMAPFHLLVRRSLPLNLQSIALTETGLCCQTQH